MPIDPNIAMSYKPVGLDIAGAMQAADERKLMQSRNALAGAQQAAAQDELNNALAARRYAGGADLNDPQNALRLFGYGKAGADMYQSLQAGRASAASARSTQGEYASKKADYYLNGVLPFARNSGKQGIISMLDMMRADPDLAGSPLASMPKEFADTNLPDPVTQPEQYAQWEQRMGLGLSEFLKQSKPDINFQTTGRGVEGYDVNAYSPTYKQPVITAPAPPKSPGVTIDMTGKGNLEATKEVVGSLVRTRESLAQAPILWQNLEEAKALIPKAKGFMGAGGEFSLEAASFLNNRFGTDIDVKGVKNATELRSRMFQGIVSTLKQLDSNPSQSQQAALQQALGGLGTDPNAMENVINVAQDIISGRVERYNRDATKASQKLDFPIDMPIEMPTRKAPTAGAAPAPPPGFKLNPR